MSKKPRMTAARFQPGLMLKAGKQWLVVNHVSVGLRKTRLTLDSGAVLEVPHDMKIVYRVPERKQGAHYAPAITRVNAEDSDNGGDLMRHK